MGHGLVLILLVKGPPFFNPTPCRSPTWPFQRGRHAKPGLEVHISGSVSSLSRPVCTLYLRTLGTLLDSAMTPATTRMTRSASKKAGEPTPAAESPTVNPSQSERGKASGEEGTAPPSLKSTAPEPSRPKGSKATGASGSHLATEPLKSRSVPPDDATTVPALGKHSQQHRGEKSTQRTEAGTKTSSKFSSSSRTREDTLKEIKEIIEAVEGHLTRLRTLVLGGSNKLKPSESHTYISFTPTH